MKAYSITAPEEIAKEYGGNKKKIQQAAAQGLINPTEAVMAGMFIDRMRNAAMQEQAQQPTVAEQVMNPQPQMPPQGMAAMPPAQQMPPQAQMGRPAPQPQMPPQPMPQQMAMGGGLDAIPYNEGSYAPGGVVSFNVGGGYGETMAQLRRQLGAARTQAQRDQIESAMSQLRAQYEQPSLVPGDDGVNIDDLVRQNVGQPIRQGLNNLGSGIQAGFNALTSAFGSGDTSDPFAVGMESFEDPQRTAGQTAPMRSTDLSLAAQQNIIAQLSPEQKARRAGLGELAAPEALAMLGEGKGTGANETFLTPEDIARLRKSQIKPRGLNAVASPMTADDAIAALGERKGTGANETFVQAPTVEEQVQQTQAGATIEDTGISEQPTVSEQITASEQAAPAVAAPEADATEKETGKTKSVEDYFKELSGLRDEEPGPYTQELRNELANRADTMSAAKKDAFNMALLQTGLGMLSQEGQPGGALQAAGKAALPAVKEATAAIRAAKKEDRELLKMGASIEQAEGRRKDALLNAAVKQHGADKTAAATIRAAEVNANRETDFDRKINGLVGGYKAADKAMGAEMQPDEVYEAQAIRYVEEQSIKRAQVAAGATTAKTVTSETEDWRGRREDFIAGLEGTDGLSQKAEWAGAFRNSEGRAPTNEEWQQEKQRRIREWNQRNPQPGTAPQPDQGQQNAIASGAGTQTSPFVVTQRVPVSQMVVGKYYSFPNGVTAIYRGNGKFETVK